MFTTLNAEDLALPVDFAETARIAGVSGFDAVDLPMEELLADTSWSAGRVEEELDRSGVRAAGWWLPIEYRYDRGTHEEGLAQLPRAARLAAAAGAAWCSTCMWPFSDELAFADNYDLHRERLGEVARRLQEHGCVLGLEFVGPATMREGHPHTFISDLHGTLELIADIGEPNVGVLLDCWQWYTSHGTAADLASLEPGQVSYVHLNDAPTGRDVDEQIDAERMLPGATGVIDVATFVGALRALRFDGPVAVEPYNAELNELEPEERSRTAYQSMRAVLAADGDEAPAA
jgi:sugar phosphate isomerase/epimerase